MSNYDDMVDRLNELRDLQTDHELALGEIQSEMEDLEYDIEQANEEEWLRGNEDRRGSACDMNAALREIAVITGGPV